MWSEPKDLEMDTALIPTVLFCVYVSVVFMFLFDDIPWPDEIEHIMPVITGTPAIVMHMSLFIALYVDIDRHRQQTKAMEHKYPMKWREQ